MQEQSWEPEIFISGIILFALYQIPGLIRQLEHFLINYSLSIFSAGSADELLISLLLVANIWLIIGFTTHLFLRSIWVAYIGLSFVYKKGIRTDRLRFRKQYDRLLFQNSGFTKTIHRLETICSTTFAVSFLLFMSILGAFFLLAITALFIALIIWLSPEQYTFYWVDPFLTVLALLYILDFVTLGWLKRIPYFSKAYYPVYRLMSWLTLSPLYRRIYYGLVSNHSKWKAGLLIFIFIFISTFLAFSIRTDSNIADVLSLRLDPKDDNSMYSGHYQNLMGDQPSNIVQIPSDVIRDDFLRVFLVHRSAFERQFIKPLCNYEERLDSMAEHILKLECLDAFYDLQINDQPIAPDFKYIKKLETNQEGLLAYLDIAHLEKGIHHLSVFYNFQHEDDKINMRKVAEVEFYKVLPAKQPHHINTSSSTPGEKEDQKEVDQYLQE